MKRTILTVVVGTLGVIGGGLLGGGPPAAQPTDPPVPLSEGLIAYWALDEGAGTIAGDGSGNGHDGELQNGPVWVEGVRGSALRFDGWDDYIRVPYAPAWDLREEITLVLWAYLEEAPDRSEGNDWRLLIGRNGFSPYGLLLEQNGRLNGTVYIGSERQAILSETPFPLQEWVHVAFSYDAKAGRARLYLQGDLLVETEAAVGTFKVREGRPLTISLPKREDSPDLHAWPGRLDEIYLFRRVLRPEEVRVLFEHAALEANVP